MIRVKMVPAMATRIPAILFFFRKNNISKPVNDTRIISAAEISITHFQTFPVSRPLWRSFNTPQIPVTVSVSSYEPFSLSTKASAV